MGLNEEYYKDKRKSLMNYLRDLAKDKRILQETIAKATGFTSNNVSRMLSGRYPPTLDNLIRLADAIGYDVAFVNKYLNEKVPDESIKPKFMFTVDPVNQELYILHRQFPSCLIHVVQEIPARFVIDDLYDDMDNPNDILNMPFVEEAKQYWRDHAESFLDKN